MQTSRFQHPFGLLRPALTAAPVPCRWSGHRRPVNLVGEAGASGRNLEPIQAVLSGLYGSVQIGYTESPVSYSGEPPQYRCCR